MDDAAVPAGLMRGDLGFLLEHDNRSPRPLEEELARYGKTDDASPDDHAVRMGRRHVAFGSAAAFGVGLRTS